MSETVIELAHPLRPDEARARVCALVCDYAHGCSGWVVANEAPWLRCDSGDYCSDHVVECTHCGTLMPKLSELEDAPYSVCDECLPQLRPDLAERLK